MLARPVNTLMLVFLKLAVMVCAFASQTLQLVLKMQNVAARIALYLPKFANVFP